MCVQYVINVQVCVLSAPHGSGNIYKKTYAVPYFHKCLVKNLHRNYEISWMRSSLVFRASDCPCRSRKSRGFDPSIFRHSTYKKNLNIVPCTFLQRN
jgi:hypothetical protein